MERKWNWLGLIVLVLGGLALAVVLSGRLHSRMAYSGMGGASSYQHAAPAAPVIPNARIQRGHNRPSVAAPQPQPPQRMARSKPGFAHGHMPMNQHFMPNAGSCPFGMPFGPLSMLFGLVDAVSKLVAMGLLAWLLLRLFQQQRSDPPPVVPTTPAGHDPRVE